jgi:hypothetical protein
MLDVLYQTFFSSGTITIMVALSSFSKVTDPHTKTMGSCLFSEALLLPDDNISMINKILDTYTVPCACILYVS